MMKAPFPYFGGKSKIAHLVWSRFGQVKNYIEPFFGSGAVLLGNPNPAPIETVNDLDGHISNFWRAVQADPEAVTRWADWPVNERDLHARHYWLITEGVKRLKSVECDPAAYDAQVAGWWIWGVCQWIGGGWCSGSGPWIPGENGWEKGVGVTRKRPHLGNAGIGINKQLPRLGDAGRGINSGSHDRRSSILDWLVELQTRLRDVRVCCGDWKRVTTNSVINHGGVTAMFLDPPYSTEAGRDNNLYRKESGTLAHEVREYALAHGQTMRIALCGYEGEHQMPDDWDCVAWKAGGGYSNQSAGNENRNRERVWFSPACLSGNVTASDKSNND